MVRVEHPETIPLPETGSFDPMQHRATSRDSALKVVSKMPVLSHFHPGRPFDIMRSEVVHWLIAQPEIAQEIFNLCKHADEICYDNGKWRL